MWALLWFLRMIFNRLFHPMESYYDKVAAETEILIQKHHESTKGDHATTLDRR